MVVHRVRWRRRLDDLAGVARRAFDLFFPPAAACLVCGQPVTGHEEMAGLCRACAGRIAWVEPPLCQRCGKPIPEGTYCGDCLRRPRLFAAVRAPAVYDGLWREAIHRLKFQGQRQLAEPLGRAMAEIGRWLPGRGLDGCHALVPVPLHPARLAQRGFNQSVLLARVVGRILGLPVLHALVRVGPPHVQSLQTAAARRRARTMFSAVQPAAVAGLTLVVVDDVLTTGATLDAAARALRRAGAREVMALVAAVGVTDADLARRGSIGNDVERSP